MDESQDLTQNNVQRAARMLEEASKILRESPRSLPTASPPVTDANNVNVSEVFRSARSMISASQSTGVLRRLGHSQRMRSLPYPNRQMQARARFTPGKQQQTKGKGEKKVLEFAVLKCAEEEQENMKWDSVIANGMLSVNENDNEEAIRQSIKESLSNKFPLIGSNDFEFVKVRHKKISIMELGPGTEYSFAVVKKMAGQGLLYVRIKPGFEFVYGEDGDSDHDFETSFMAKAEENNNHTVSISPAQSAVNTISPEDGNDIQPHHEGLGEHDTQEVTGPHHANDLRDNEPDDLLLEMDKQSLSDPVEILRFLQQQLIKGRAMDVVDDNSSPEGETNYITVDRSNIVKTTFAEFESIDDYCKTFEVDFMGEEARDLGGPRKEWIRLMNHALKDKYFSNGLREFLSDEYFFVGVMMGIALLQNGQLPCFLPLDVIDRLINKQEEDKCIINLQRGLDVFGLTRVFRHKPVMLHLLRPTNAALTSAVLLKLLKPVFSPDMSTAYSKEKEVYACFVKYVRQLASGRRHPLSLSSILIFVTGAAEEPVLGFTMHPSITFSHGEKFQKVQ